MLCQLWNSQTKNRWSFICQYYHNIVIYIIQKHLFTKSQETTRQNWLKMQVYRIHIYSFIYVPGIAMSLLLVAINMISIRGVLRIRYAVILYSTRESTCAGFPRFFSRKLFNNNIKKRRFCVNYSNTCRKVAVRGFVFGQSIKIH